jgi:hypothetical protein
MLLLPHYNNLDVHLNMDTRPSLWLEMDVTDEATKEGFHLLVYGAAGEEGFELGVGMFDVELLPKRNEFEEIPEGIDITKDIIWENVNKGLREIDSAELKDCLMKAINYGLGLS